MSVNLEHKFANLVDCLLTNNQILDNVFAVGVSGGADSLALLFLLKSWADQQNKKLIALTVDHGLRAASSAEADYVADLMKAHNVEHHILVWRGDKPTTGIEEAARTARYNLIEEFCLHHNISNVFVGHHKLDQIETFFMRLHRGSGLDGLSSMSDFTKLGSLNILRPMLSLHPKELQEYLLCHNIEWKEDESNNNEDFLRVRFRKLVPYLEDELGFSLDRIYNTTLILGRAKDYINSEVSKFISNHVIHIAKSVVRVDISSLLQQNQEILFRVLRDLLQTVSGNIYSPRAKDIERLCFRLSQDSYKFKNSTLGGCEIINFDKSLWILPEDKSDFVLSKKDWEKFIVTSDIKLPTRLPYKVRKIIYRSNLSVKQG